MQRFPAALTEFAVIVKKVGDTKMSSSQLAAQQVMPAQGETFIGGRGHAGRCRAAADAVADRHAASQRGAAMDRPDAGARHRAVGRLGRHAKPGRCRPRARPSASASSARREKLLADLVRLERERGKARDERRYGARREEIVASLEHVYGALDSDGVTPGPGNTAGVAA